MARVREEVCGACSEVMEIRQRLTRRWRDVTGTHSFCHGTFQRCGHPYVEEWREVVTPWPQSTLRSQEEMLAEARAAGLDV